MPYQSINPNDGKLLKSFEHMSSARLDEALAAAELGFQAWKRKSYAERGADFPKVIA
jgi:succinate-semialdehyde dehydrogenase / glutarate-semialdehyde dehydrogenase